MTPSHVTAKGRLLMDVRICFSARLLNSSPQFNEEKCLQHGLWKQPVPAISDSGGNKDLKVNTHL